MIKLFEVIDSPKNLFLVMEHAPSGSLLDYVRGRKRLSEADACVFFQQVNTRARELARAAAWRVYSLVLTAYCGLSSFSCHALTT